MIRKPFGADDPVIPMNYLAFALRTLSKDGYEVEALLAGTLWNEGRAKGER